MDQDADKMTPMSRDIYTLPSSDIVYKLVDVYFDKTGHSFPVLHKTAVLDTFLKVQSSKQSRESRECGLWLALFNVVLAIAVSTSANSLDDYGNECNDPFIFFRRAQQIAVAVKDKEPTLETGKSLHAIASVDVDQLTTLCFSTISTLIGALPAKHA